MSNALERQIKASLDSRESRAILRRVNPPAHLTPFVDFSSNDYLSLSTDHKLRDLFVERISNTELVLGSGGSRLLDGNKTAHFELETRLMNFFRSPAALLFNSGFDANVAIFSTLPQQGDLILLDELIHASVWDGCRSSRARDRVLTFKHNDIASLTYALTSAVRSEERIASGEASVFVAVETLYSMDGDFAPLSEVVNAVKKALPQGNGHIVVDEAHSTGIYGTQGRGISSLLGLESEILIRLHTFGKALASNGAIVLCSPLVRSYLVNYARSLIFTTALGHSNVISIDCSFDMLETGYAKMRADELRRLCHRFLNRIRPLLQSVSKQLLSLPIPQSVPHPDLDFSPIIPLLTSQPRPLAAHLQSHGYLARPITWPTVPKGQDRVRLCLHAANTENEIDGLVMSITSWVEARVGQLATQSNAHLLCAKL